MISPHDGELLPFPISSPCGPSAKARRVTTHLLVLDVVRLVHDDHSECEVFAVVPQLPQEVVGCNDRLQARLQIIGHQSMTHQREIITKVEIISTVPSREEAYSCSQHVRTNLLAERCAVRMAIPLYLDAHMQG